MGYTLGSINTRSQLREAVGKVSTTSFLFHAIFRVYRKFDYYHL